mgnify:CR=1 FL=1
MMKRNSKSPFFVRNITFDFTDAKNFWAGDNPSLTMYFNALSSLFPDGERYFVNSVRAVRDQVTDDVLRDKITSFIGQEAMHSREHERLNQTMERRGIPLSSFEAFASRGLAGVAFALSPKLQLAITCALEHFTASLAAELLRRDDIQNLIEDEELLRLWIWHAVEEIEHKDVAFDVFKHVYGTSFAQRAAVMVLASIGLFVVHTWMTIRLCSKFSNLEALATLRTLYGRRGFITGIIPEMVKYFNPSFHPSKIDHVSLLKEWQERIKQ